MTERLQFRWGYYDDIPYRRQLNALVQEVFRIDFGIWNQAARTFGQYTPFSYEVGGQIVANVSASPMEMVLLGKAVRAVQIGTVATLQSYRGRGLARNLMEKAHEHWDAQCDLAFLFANDSVLEFYQQFGYRAVQEYTFKAVAPDASPVPRRRARKLDLSRPEDLQLLTRLADGRVPVSQYVGVHDHTWLLLFHAAVGYPGDLSYIEDLDVVAIHTCRGSTLRLVDVVGDHVPTLAELFPYVGGRAIDTVEFGFVPDSIQAEGVKVEVATDSHLFVRGHFPLEETQFRFPETSQA